VDPVAYGGRLHAPACAFVIAYGVARLAGFGLYHDGAAGPLVVAAGAEPALTILAVLALVRRGRGLLLAAVAGWTADLASPAVVAAVHGDTGRLLDHGLPGVAFAVLTAVTYRLGRRQGDDTARGGTLTDLRVADPDATRQDLPAGATRLDLPVRRPEATRPDLPVRGRPPRR
jgi:hypothetical protein